MNLSQHKVSEATPKVKEFLSHHPIVDKLNTLCKEKGWKAHIVGGFPRDMLFGEKPNDVDIIIENCDTIQSLASGVSSFGLGKVKEKGSFDKHFDINCNGTAFSIFRAENTYGGIGKEKATVKDVISAFDFSLNVFVINLPEINFSDPLYVLEPTFDEGSYYILPTNNTPYINNIARTILRGLKLGAKFEDVELDELSEGWMNSNQGHIRKISLEDFDHILGSLNEEQKSWVMAKYNEIWSFQFSKANQYVRKIVEKNDFSYHKDKYSEPKKIAIAGDGGNLSYFETVLFDYKKVIEEFEAHDTYFDTPEGSLKRLGLLFRTREKIREGSDNFVELSLKSDRWHFDDGLTVQTDNFAKLTKDQRKELLSSLNPFQFKELGPVKSLKDILSEHNVDINSLKPVQNIVANVSAVVLQDYSIPLYFPFSDPNIKTQIAPNLGLQIEIRFNKIMANGKEVYTIEVSSPRNTSFPEIITAAGFFPGAITDKTKLQLVS